MVRAGRIVGKAGLKIVEAAGVRSYHIAPGAWTVAVGKKIASHARPTFLDGARLIIEVDDPVWRTQLSSLAEAILKRIETVIGEGIVTALEFRVAIPKRGPTIAGPSGFALAPADDEADAIEDPIMRRVYRDARRKASK